MSSISSINTNFYPELLEGFAPKTLLPVDAVKRDSQEQAFLSSFDSRYKNDIVDNDVDLSNYYSNIRPEDLLNQVGRNVSKSAQDLDNAMVSALKNGFSVNDVCNIKLAQVAYKANAYVFNIANKISTFELKI